MLAFERDRSQEIVGVQCRIGPGPGEVEGTLCQLLGFVARVLTALHGEKDGHLLTFRRERV